MPRQPMNKDFHRYEGRGQAMGMRNFTSVESDVFKQMTFIRLHSDKIVLLLLHKVHKVPT